MKEEHKNKWLPFDSSQGGERLRRGIVEEREREGFSSRRGRETRCQSRWERETRSRRVISDWFRLIPSRRGWDTTSTPTAPPIDSVDERTPLDSVDSTQERESTRERSGVDDEWPNERFGFVSGEKCHQCVTRVKKRRLFNVPFKGRLHLNYIFIFYF